MVVAIWTSSLSLAIVTSYPAVWLADLVVESIDVPVADVHDFHSVANMTQIHSGLNALLVLSSAIQWAVIGVLFRAILQKISK
jgi:hypothetical protein